MLIFCFFQFITALLSRYILKYLDYRMSRICRARVVTNWNERFRSFERLGVKTTFAIKTKCGIVGRYVSDFHFPVNFKRDFAKQSYCQQFIFLYIA